MKMASAVLAGSSTSTSNENLTLDLLQRLQNAISNGQHQIASMIAAELAKMRVDCNVTMRRSEIQSVNQKSAEEPIRVQVQPDMTISDLESQIYQQYKVPIRDRCLVLLGTALSFREGAGNFDAVQENVVDVPLNGDVAAPNDVGDVHGNDTGKVTEQKDSGGDKWACSQCTYLNEITHLCCSICLTDRIGASNTEVISIASGSSPVAEVKTKGGYSNYLELLDMENTDLITNLDAFECPICITVHHPGEGVVLKTCLHSFCRDCLSRMIETSSDAEIRCPYIEDYSCGTLLQDREIRALVSAEVYDRYQTLSMNEAESKMSNTFHCKTPNCTGWCVFEDDVNEFICPVCQHNNCLTCQVLHEGLNCDQYQRKIMFESANDPEANKTRLHLEDMLEKGEAMTCPKCKIIILKRSGCDAILCSICKTEICWVTKGPRWGPRGRGDTSGGCGCTPMKRCHPNCGNCH